MSKSMNLQEIYSQLQEASPFELYRLSRAIDKSLEDPDCTKALRAKVKIGMQVQYFSAEKNKLCDAIISAVKRTNVSFINLEAQSRWSYPLYALNLDNIDT